jgi:RTA1 like protein
MIITIFVIADVLTIILQIAGAALIGVAESNIADGIKPPLTPEQANDILRAGLAIQVFFITIFLSILCFLIFRLINSGTYKETARTWQEKAILSILTSSTFFIYLRTVYRLAEAAVGVESGPTLNQPLFAALETVPVFVAVIAWTVLPIHTLL